MSLVSILENKTSTQESHGDDQGRWRQFVLDHLDYIAARSKSYDIEPALMNQFRYDLKRFIRSHLNQVKDIAWIVLLVNGLPNDFSWHEPGMYLIPDDTLIVKLYHSYATINNNSNTF